MSNSAYALLLSVKDILNNEIDPLLETYSNDNPSSELTAIFNRLNDIYEFITTQRSAYYGLFTCEAGQTVTANNQIIPFSVGFGGSIIPNADGTFTLPSNTKWIIDADISGTFSTAGIITFAIFNADSGNELFTIWSVSENYNSSVDYAEIRTNTLNVGSSPLRLGLKVVTKQSSGTFTFTQYSSYIKVQEV